MSQPISASKAIQETPIVPPQVESVPPPVGTELVESLSKISANLDKITDKLTQVKVEKTTSSHWKYLAYAAGAAALGAVALCVNPGKVGDILSHVPYLGKAVFDVAKQAPRAMNVTLNVVEAGMVAIEQTPGMVKTALNVGESVAAPLKHFISESPSALAIIDDYKGAAEVVCNMAGTSIGGFRNIVKLAVDLEAPSIDTTQQETALGADYFANLALTGVLNAVAGIATNLAFNPHVPSSIATEARNSIPDGVKMVWSLGFPYLVTALGGGVTDAIRKIPSAGSYALEMIQTAGRQVGGFALKHPTSFNPLY